MNRAQVNPDEFYTGGMLWWIEHEPDEMRKHMRSCEEVQRDRAQGAEPTEPPKTGRPRTVDTKNTGLVQRIVQSFQSAAKPYDCEEVRARVGWVGSKKQFFEALHKAYQRGFLVRLGKDRSYRYRKA